MSRKQKILLAVVAVVFIALFVVAVGGRDPGNGNAKGHHGFVDWLSGLGGQRSVIPAKLVTGDCVQPDHSLALTGPCVLHVADPGSLKSLVLNGSVSFEVVAPLPGDATGTTRGQVDPDDNGLAQARIALDKAGDVLVACVGTPACTLTIGNK
jgi:hypothetical protein